MLFRSVTLYSGVIPMLAAAGNTTDDGVVAAIVNDRLTRWEAGAPGLPMEAVTAATPFARPVRVLGALLLLPGLVMLVAPQARSGLPALQWLSRTTFHGEALAGAAVLLVGLTCLFGARRR